MVFMRCQGQNPVCPHSGVRIRSLVGSAHVLRRSRDALQTAETGGPVLATKALTSVGARHRPWRSEGLAGSVRSGKRSLYPRRGAGRATPGCGRLQQRRSTAIARSFFSLRHLSEPSSTAALARASRACKFRRSPHWAQQPRPNPSVEPRPNGVAPGPRSAEAYHALRGPGATPSAPPHLER